MTDAPDEAEKEAGASCARGLGGLLAQWEARRNTPLDTALPTIADMTR
jgi:hypothetical protein